MQLHSRQRYQKILHERKISVDEFISMVTSKLGIGESESRSATGGILKMLQEQLDDSTFGSLMEKLPGASALLSEAETGDSGGEGGGLMGSLKSMAGGLLGGGGGAAGVAKALSDSGIGLDKAGGFLARLVAFLKEKLGDDMFATIASKVPGLGGNSE